MQDIISNLNIMMRNIKNEIRLTHDIEHIKILKKQLNDLEELRNAIEYLIFYHFYISSINEADEAALEILSQTKSNDNSPIMLYRAIGVYYYFIKNNAKKYIDEQDVYMYINNQIQNNRKA